MDGLMTLRRFSDPNAQEISGRSTPATGAPRQGSLALSAAPPVPRGDGGSAPAALVPDGFSLGSSIRASLESAANAPARQLVLALEDRPSPRAEKVLVSDSNYAAVALVEDPAAWQAGLACLVGPAGSGKTHMTRQLHPDALRITERDLALSTDPDERPGFAAVRPGAVHVFDDLDRAVTEPVVDGIETALFHLLNVVDQRGARLLFTARTPPARWPIDLPDLKTRVTAASLGVVAPPDDVMLAALLRKLFDEFGLEVEKSVIDYLVNRMHRSYGAAIAIAERLNRASLSEQRAVTSSLAAAVLGWRPARF